MIFLLRLIVFNTNGQNHIYLMSEFVCILIKCYLIQHTLYIQLLGIPVNLSMKTTAWKSVHKNSLTWKTRIVTKNVIYFFVFLQYQSNFWFPSWNQKVNPVCHTVIGDITHNNRRWTLSYKCGQLYTPIPVFIHV